MSRRVPKVLVGLLSIGAVLLVAPGTGRAQIGTGGTVVGGTGGTGGTSTALGPTDFFIGVQGEEGTNLKDYERGIYFNKANCECERPTWVYVALSQTGLAKRNTITSGNVRVFVGTSCDQTLLRPDRCTALQDSVLLTDLAARGGITIKTNAKLLSTRRVNDSGGAVTVAPCTETQKITQTIYVVIDTNADGTDDLIPTLGLPIDTAPPPPPTDINVRGGNEALVVDWKPVNTSAAEAADLLGYQLLCNRAGSLQVFSSGSFSPGFASKATQCPDATTEAGSVEALDPKFLCSGLLGPAAVSHRIKILQNAITYGVTVIAIDKFLNPSPADVFFGSPVASIGFYNRYRDGNEVNGAPGGSPDPGGDEGGFCTLGGDSATARGFAAVPVLGLGVAAIALARRRRRRR